MNRIAIVILMLFAAPLRAESGDLISGQYDHDLHNTKVFKPLKVACSHCHNFNETKPGQIELNANVSTSVFKRPMKEICHECHRSGEAKYQAAPKACTTCHRSIEHLKNIKPQNHSNVAWKTSHATEARVSGDSCLNCHMTSQCVKCHLQRNESDLRNHTRNFKFTHSIQARLQPEKCDTCHTKSYCVECHMGKR